MSDVIQQVKEINLPEHMKQQGVHFNGSSVAHCPFHEDKNPSLSVNRKDGVWVWRCFSEKHDPRLNGGTIIDWEKNRGLDESEAIKKIKEKYNIRDGSKPAKEYGPVESEYIYQNEKGQEVYRKIRFEGKKFLTKPKGEKQIPYHLPELIKSKTVFIVEGEKDADELRKLKIPATTTGGTNSWKKEHAAYFKDKKVIVCLDSGTLDYMKKIAEDLKNVAKEIRIVDLGKYGFKKDQDVSDYIETCTAGDLREAVLQLAREAPVYEGKEENQEPDKTETEIHLTDMGNAERFANQNNKNTKYCHPWGKWLHFTGKRWEKDDSGKVERKARETVKRMYAEASKLKTKAARKEMADFAMKCESTQKIRSMLSLAQSESEIPIQPHEMDSNPWLINLKNGTLDLKTGELKAHKKEDFITKLAPVEYDPKAECPRFKGFLSEIMGGNEELISFIQKAFGYGLSGSTREHMFFILHGKGANGKTTLLTTILYILGDYAQRTPVETLLLRRTAGIPNDVARLKGSRFVSAMEVEQNRRLAESLVKALTGGDRLIARFLFGEFFEFDPQFKLFLGTNHKPIIRGTDWAIWRRIKLIPFEVVIPDEDQDKNLLNKLKEESSGILNWLLEGCLLWQREGLESPEKVKEATHEYKIESDVIGQFFQDCVIEDEESRVRSSELYNSYKNWCETNGEKAMSQTSFGRILTERGHKKNSQMDANYYLGLKLKE